MVLVPIALFAVLLVIANRHATPSRDRRKAGTAGRRAIRGRGGRGRPSPTGPAENQARVPGFTVRSVVDQGPERLPPPSTTTSSASRPSTQTGRPGGGVRPRPRPAHDLRAHGDAPSPWTPAGPPGSTRCSSAGPARRRGSRTEAVERVRFTLPRGTWPFLMNWPMRSALRHPRSDGRLPWWYPPQRPDARAATGARAAGHALARGRLPRHAAQPDHDVRRRRVRRRRRPPRVMPWPRPGSAALLAVGLGALADRRGRRLILSLALFTCIGADRGRSLLARSRDPGGDAGRQPGRLGRLRAPAGRDRRRGDARRRPGLRPQPAVDDRRAGRGHRAVGPAGRRPRRTRRGACSTSCRWCSCRCVIRFGGLIPESRRFVRSHRNVPLAGALSPARALLAAIWPAATTSSPAPQSQFLNEYLRDERGMSARP